jgi:hypothetical protein
MEAQTPTEDTTAHVFWMDAVTLRYCLRTRSRSGELGSEVPSLSSKLPSIQIMGIMSQVKHFNEVWLWSYGDVEDAPTACKVKAASVHPLSPTLLVVTKRQSEVCNQKCPPPPFCLMCPFRCFLNTLTRRRIGLGAVKGSSQLGRLLWSPSCRASGRRCADACGLPIRWLGS